MALFHKYITIYSSLTGTYYDHRTSLIIMTLSGLVYCVIFRVCARRRQRVSAASKLEHRSLRVRWGELAVDAR